MIYTFDISARMYLVDWQNRNEKSCSEDECPHMLEFLRKTETHIVRFALVIQVMRDADTGAFGNSRTICSESAILSTLLADYYLATVRDAYEYIVTGGEDVARKMKFFSALDGTFTTAQAKAIADSMNLSYRTMFRMLDVKEDDPFIRRVGRGVYSKVFH